MAEGLQPRGGSYDTFSGPGEFTDSSDGFSESYTTDANGNIQDTTTISASLGDNSGVFSGVPVPGAGTSGNGLGWQINKFQVRGPTVTTGTITQLSRIDCAASYGNQTSLVSQARIQGDNFMGQGAQVLLSNTFSGLVDFGHTVANATNAAPVYWGLLTNGARLGLRQ